MGFDFTAFSTKANSSRIADFPIPADPPASLLLIHTAFAHRAICFAPSCCIVAGTIFFHRREATAMEQHFSLWNQDTSNYPLLS